MTYKLDKTFFSSQYANYEMFQSYIAPFVISGTLATGHSNVYFAGFTITGGSAANTRANVSIQRHDTGLRAPFNANAHISGSSPNYEIYRFAGSEQVRCELRYPVPGSIQVYFFISNSTGSTINLVSQQLDALIDFYVAPIA